MIKDNQNTAFIVLGPESSGTRLTTSILISGGCLGSAEHEQPFDKYTIDDFKDKSSPIVWRRSVPHNKQWPDFYGLFRRLPIHWDIHIIITIRDWYYTIESQLAATHVNNKQQAMNNIKLAYISIFDMVNETGYPITMVSYESLISNPVQVQRRLLKDLGLQQIVRLDIYDGNAKYLDR